jgi:hypothetical protein
LKRSKTISLILLPVLLIAVLAVFQANCPLPGIALSSEMRSFIRLKNRTALPEEAEFDRQVTLAALLQPGDDRGRWADTRAAVIEGYVVEVGIGSIEMANCYSLTRRDIHIHVALRPDVLSQERVVVEVTPVMAEWAKGQGLDWSGAALRRALPGRWCRFEGWLLFDVQHADESENTAPGRAGNWRATAWEVHPVTRLEVLRQNDE